MVRSWAIWARGWYFADSGCCRESLLSYSYSLSLICNSFCTGSVRVVPAYPRSSASRRGRYFGWLCRTCRIPCCNYARFFCTLYRNLMASSWPSSFTANLGSNSSQTTFFWSGPRFADDSGGAILWLVCRWILMYYEQGGVSSLYYLRLRSPLKKC